MGETDFKKCQKIINEAFNDCKKGNNRLSMIVLALIFVISLLLMLWKFYITNGLSSIEFLIQNPANEFKIMALEAVSIVLFSGSTFAFILVFVVAQKDEYFDIAKQNCVNFLKENKNKITVDDVIKKLKEEIDWVENNISQSPI